MDENMHYTDSWIARSSGVTVDRWIAEHLHCVVCQLQLGCYCLCRSRL